MIRCEIRADNILHIEGYVNAVERDSRPVMVPSLGRCVEQVRAGVFGAALAANPDVELLENHDHSRKLGSTSDGVLVLSEDAIGLRASADISDADIIAKARTGQLKGWSFGFVTTASEVENRADNIPRRVVTGMKLSEVSLIDGRYTPCYAGTLVEVRAIDDNTEIVEFRADEEIEVVDNSPENESPAPDYSYYERAIQLLELRYNPYHDPSNGRFCSGGGGGGGVLVVEKGQKGKGVYVFDRDIDSEYEQWKSQKTAEKSNSANANIYNRKYATSDEYKQALAEKYNGITDVSKIKTAKDVSDFINYDTQKGFYATTGLIDGSKGFKSTWDSRNGEVKLYDPGFSSNGTTAFDMPKFQPAVFNDSISKLQKSGINVGHWYDNKYMVTKKKGARTSKWLEGLEAFRAFATDESDEYG